MNDKYKYLIKNTSILTISNFSSKFLVFLLVPIYTNVLSTSEYGIYDLIISTVLLLYPILTANIIDGVMRFSMEKKADHKKIISIALRFIFLGILILIVMLYINRLFELWKDIIGKEIYIFLYYVTYVFNQLLIQFSKGLERIKDMGIAGVIGTFAMIISNILLLIVWNYGLSGFFIASILGQLIPVIYLSLRLNILKFLSLKIDKQLQHEMLVYSIPLILSVISWWINSTLDKYVVTFFFGLAANGLISIAYKIPSILNTIQGIFIQAWQVSAIKEYDSEESKKFYSGTFIYMNAMLCISCSFLILLTRPIAHILYSNDFYQAWQYVPFLLVSSVLNASAGYIGPILSAKKDTKSMAKSAIYGTIVNVVFNILLVWLIGVQGATIATLLSSFIIYYVRKIKVANVIVSPKYKYVILSWIILSMQAVCEIFLHSYLGSCLFVLIIICLYKSSITAILKKIIKK